MNDKFDEHAKPPSVQFNDGGRRPRTSATGSQEPRNADAPESSGLEFRFRVVDVPASKDDTGRAEAKGALARMLVDLYIARHDLKDAKSKAA
jgi:hypothetical protein